MYVKVKTPKDHPQTVIFSVSYSRGFRIGGRVEQLLIGYIFFIYVLVFKNTKYIFFVFSIVLNNS